MITNAQKINYKYLSLCPPDCVAAEGTALFAYMHMQIVCSVRVALCTCCALCAIKHMTQKHWCVRAAREREEGVKTHRYAVLKGCRERDIVRPPFPFKLHQSYRPLPCFIPAVGSREKQCGDDGDDLNTAVASHYRGEAVMRLSSQP